MDEKIRRETQIARNGSRFYRVTPGRYFPIKRAVAEHMLATGAAVEVEYFPFSQWGK